MSGFAYFCRNKSRSRKPAQPAAKRLLNLNLNLSLKLNLNLNLIPSLNLENN